MLINLNENYTHLVQKSDNSNIVCEDATVICPSWPLVCDLKNETIQCKHNISLS